MKSQISIFALTLAATLSVCQTQPAPVHKVPVHRISAAQKAQPQAPAAQDAPAQEPTPPVQPPPPTPEQGPSSPPQVSFQGGQLTIEARNSTMGDVLNAVKQKTGATVDMPASSSERVVGRFGPGAPRDVLAQLLNGSHYDYVLLGSPADPGALNKIVLMARAVGPEPAPSPQQQRAQQNLQAVPEVDNDQNTTDDASADVPADVQQQPDDQSQVPDQNLQQDQPQPAPNGPIVKTPEQLLRELQQQQQQQQNPPQQ